MTMRIYQMQQGDWPQPVYRDDEGVPIRSWRGEITPILECSEYDRGEAWNSPRNAAIKEPMLLGCRNYRTQTLDPYLLLMNPTVERAEGDWSKTPSGEYPFLLVEARDSGIGVFEPRDITMVQLRQGIRAFEDYTSGVRVGGRHSLSFTREKGGRFLIAFPDQNVLDLPQTTTPDELLRFFTISHAKKIVNDRFQTAKSVWRNKIILMTVYLFALFVVIIAAIRLSRRFHLTARWSPEWLGVMSGILLFAFFFVVWNVGAAVGVNHFAVKSLGCFSIAWPLSAALFTPFNDYFIAPTLLFELVLNVLNGAMLGYFLGTFADLYLWWQSNCGKHRNKL